MASLRTRVGHGLAKGLGIKLQKSDPYQDELTRGESVLSVQTGETFIEEEPTTVEFLQEVVPNGGEIRDYVWSLFPFLHWIGFYNWQWFVGDMVAGTLQAF
jgi:sodium-independent sulfate anion transporter 11